MSAPRLSGSQGESRLRPLAVLLLLALTPARLPAGEEAPLPAATGAAADVAAARERARVLSARGETSQALAILRTAEAANPALPPADQARLQLDIATVARELGRWEEGLVAAERLLASARAASEPRLVATGLQVAGLMHAMRGEAGRALEHLQQARAAYRDAGVPQGAAKMLELQAFAYRRFGRHGEALAALQQALSELEALGEALMAAEVRGELGELYVMLGRFDLARPLVEAAVQQAEQAGQPLRAVPWQLALAEGLSRSRRYAEAQPLLRRARDAYLDARHAGRACAAASALALALAWGGQPAEALAELDLTETRRARLAGDGALEGGPGSGGDAGPRPSPAWGQFARATALEALDREDEAQALYEDEAARARAGDGDRQLVGSLAALARIDARRGDPARALALAHEAVSAWRQRAAGTQPDAAPSWWRTLRAVVDVGVYAARRQADSVRGPREAALDEALFFLEQGRSGGLVSALALEAAGVDAEVPQALREAAARTGVDVARLQQRLQAASARATGDPAELLSLRAALQSSHERREAALVALGLHGRGARAGFAPAEQHVAEVRAALPAGAAYVAFHLPLGEASALVITAQHAGIVGLGPAAALADKADAWLALASTPDGPEERLAAELHADLIAPLLPLLAGSSRWIVSPDGALDGLPLEALGPGEGTQGDRLLAAVEITYVPSFSAWRQLARAPALRGGRAVVLGDPVYPGEAVASRGTRGLGRLAFSGDEARSAAAKFDPVSTTVLLRETATLSALQEALAPVRSPIRLLHLACHASSDFERPRLSSLILAGGEAWSLDAILHAHVPAELVVLSACETARGGMLRGEGPQALQRAFFAAGALRVVASSWPVSDASTRRLMDAFYAAWQTEGASATAALRRARLALRAAGGASAHPYHWAPFTCWGRPD